MKGKSEIGKAAIGLIVTALAFQLGSIAAVQAQDFPKKPITLVLPSVPGGSIDLTSRTFVHLSQEILGQPMVVQMKPGGAGAVGLELVAQAKPDGYTLAMAHSNQNSVLPALEGLGKGPGEMEPICLLNMMNYIYYVKSNSPFKTMKDVINYAKANPEKLVFGNSGTWSVVDLEWRGLELKAGIKTRNVPHDGGGAVLIALLGDHIQIAILPPTQSLPHYRAGKLRPLAIQGKRRFAGLPNVPSMKEEGLDVGIEGVWMGVIAPKGTPRPIINKLAAGFKKMTENKQAIEAYAKLGNEFNYLGPDEFGEFWRKDFQVYKDMAKIFKQ